MKSPRLRRFGKCLPVQESEVRPYLPKNKINDCHLFKHNRTNTLALAYLHPRRYKIIDFCF